RAAAGAPAQRGGAGLALGRDVDGAAGPADAGTPAWLTPFAVNAESPFWSPGVAGLEPYVPGEQPRIAGLVKLNTNEHPLPPSAHVTQAIARAAHEGLERYPDPESTALREVLAARLGLAPMQVFVGNGSDEV